MGGHDLAAHGGSFESSACSHGEEMLGEHVQRHAQRAPGFDAASGQCFAGGGEFNQLKSVRRHAENAADGPGLVAAASRPLLEAGHPFWTAHLNNLIDRRKIHAEVEAAGADHTFHCACAETVLGGSAVGSFNGAMMHRKVRRPPGAEFQQGLIPQFSLGPGVGE